MCLKNNTFPLMLVGYKTTIANSILYAYSSLGLFEGENCNFIAWSCLSQAVRITCCMNMYVQYSKWDLKQIYDLKTILARVVRRTASASSSYKD